MPKFHINHELVSYGIYSKWDRESRELPEIQEFTRTVPARIGIEFGYILNFKKAKGKKIEFCIEHPPFKDSEGNAAPPFTGEVFVGTNNWNFYLGDTIWAPENDKEGTWRLITSYNGKIIADESFNIVKDV